MGKLLEAASHIVVPSQSTGNYISLGFPTLDHQLISHPNIFPGAPKIARSSNLNDIIMIGDIGPHKGLQLLRDLAKHAKLTYKPLFFRIVDLIDINQEFLVIMNVKIMSKYKPEELTKLAADTVGCLALFLFRWPETYCHALSEAVLHGFILVVLDISALARRVCAAQFGVVFQFPSDRQLILKALDDVAEKRIALWHDKSRPYPFF